MKELITIREENGRQLVSARDLYNLLEVESRFNDWIARMFQYGFIENIDYSLCYFFQSSKESGRGGHNAKDYALSLNCAKEISMIQRSEKGKQARLYFIECERKLKQSVNLILPKDYSSALRALASEFERAEIAENKVKELKPKGEAYDSFIEYDGFFNFKQVADLFDIPKVGRNEFMAMLRKDSIINERNEPYRTQINMGRFKTCLQDTNGIKVGHSFIPRYNTLISPKGIDFLFKKYSHLILDIDDFNNRKYKLIQKES